MNFENSQLFLQKVSFPGKIANEFAKQPAFCQKHGTNSQNSWLPGKSALQL
jgi:hypothetical protein